MSLIQRRTAGTPAGGQFAATEHKAADLNDIDMGIDEPTTSSAPFGVATGAFAPKDHLPPSAPTTPPTRENIERARDEMRNAEKTLRKQRRLRAVNPSAQAHLDRVLDQAEHQRTSARENYRELLRNGPESTRDDYVKDLAARRRGLERTARRLSGRRTVNPSAQAQLDRVRTGTATQIDNLDSEIQEACAREAREARNPRSPRLFRPALMKLDPAGAKRAIARASLDVALGAIGSD